MIDPAEDRWLDQLPLLNGIHQEEIQLKPPIEQVAARFANDRGTVLLLSGSDLDCSRYHILAVDPWLEVYSTQDKTTIACHGKPVKIKQDVFDVVQSIITRYNITDKIENLPVISGLFGYFAYDLKDRIETLPKTCMGTNLPDLYLSAPRLVLVQDKTAETTHLCIPRLEMADGPAEKKYQVEAVKNWFFKRLDTPIQAGEFSVECAALESSFTKQEYIHAVNRIIRYLKAGDIYQANLSQRFETGLSGDTYALFLDLFRRNPASFFAYVNAGNHVIVSTSPERFIKQEGRYVETRPIKGTIARGATKEQDIQNGITLVNSVKDDAELTMIVDLMRNDLSRVTRHGSVIVTEHKRLEPYENVYHLVSVVKGELEDGKTPVDLIKATFPGGSITGCPKIRSMEIIDELEPVKRHVYTGSIGYVSFHDTMDLSIAIRTATIANGRVFFSVGGGIVYDSDPEKEFQETLDKGKTLMESLAGNKSRTSSPSVKAWFNGKIIDQKKACVSPLGSGFQYGAGLFETIKVSENRIFFLEGHIRRLNRSWETLFDLPAPDVCWESIIRLLIRENSYQDRDLAVKIMIAKDLPENRGGIYLAAFARPYIHRLEMVGKPGLDLTVYPYPRQTILADHKSMNYLLYDLAGQFAKKFRSDEALILNPDGTVSETNTANILAVEDFQVIVPQSDHVLAGVTLQKILEILKNNGYEIQKEKVPLQNLKALPNIILTNSLMGVVKALHIDGEAVKHDTDICSFINEQLFRSNT